MSQLWYDIAMEGITIRGCLAETILAEKIGRFWGEDFVEEFSR